MHPNSLLSSFVPTAFSHMASHNQDMEDKSPQEADAGTMPLPAMVDSFSLSTLSHNELSFSFSATYNRVGRIDAPAVGNKSGSVLSLGKLKKIFKKITHAVKNLEHQLDSNISALYSRDMLQKLVNENSFAQQDDKTDLPRISLPDFSSFSGVEFTSVKGFQLDVELDYKGLLKWKGQIFETEMHMEIHLTHVEAAHFEMNNVNKWADHDLQQISNNVLDTGRYLISFNQASSLEIFDKATNLSTTVANGPNVNPSDVDVKDNSNEGVNDEKESNILTILNLLDSTNVVIKTQDTGFIREVDVSKGKKHAKAFGFIPPVNHNKKGHGKVHVHGNRIGKQHNLFKNMMIQEGNSPGSRIPHHRIKKGKAPVFHAEFFQKILDFTAQQKI